MKNVRVARRYARALMDAARAADAIEHTAKDRELLSGLLGKSRELRLLLVSPVVPEEKNASYTLENVNPFTPPPAFGAISPLTRVPLLADTAVPEPNTLPAS